MNRKYASVGLIFVLMLAALFPYGPSSKLTASTTKSEKIVEEKADLVRIHLEDRDELDKLIATGADVMEHLHEHGDGYEMDVLVTPSQLKDLQEQGFETTTVTTKEEINKIKKEREQAAEKEAELLSTVDRVDVIRADYFTNQDGSFLYVEAKTSAGDAASVALTGSWDKGAGTKIGDGGSATLSRKSDENTYMYHSFLVPVDYRPDKVKISSNLGGFSTHEVNNWLGDGKPVKDDHYATGFIDHYMTPTEITNRMEQLAREFPKLAEIIEMPYKTNGYRRHSQAILGEQTDTAVVVTSKSYGHEGGNDIKVTHQASEKADAPLSIQVNSNHIIVNLATDKDGKAISTANDVVKGINENASDLVEASTYRDNEGKGIAEEVESTLTDSLSAPDEVTHDPYLVKAIRIGKQRDGSKVGVLAYSQEHAREWVTPLVSIETAERLLRNYQHDKDTQELLDNLDIFIVPTVNPDGGHYSFYDYNWQRKNMTNYCKDGTYTDPNARNYWGVDLNRNHPVGSVYDGYAGASTDCTSYGFAGPEELSEPEAQNLDWLANQYDNIKFAMNIHSYGGYFMWPPGAYKPETRETLPRPTAGEEAYFWSASRHILEEIQKHRGTVILPSRTGPIPDVLYSAAGNSADNLWYDKGIYTWNFEVGADLWNAEENKWELVGFQPEFAEGYEEAMEFSNGLIGLMEVANKYGEDKEGPTSNMLPGSGRYKGAVEVSFETSEPATVFYTMDGSKPTLESKAIQVDGIRGDAETLTITESTMINWFSVDASGNIERGYDPQKDEQGYHTSKVQIVSNDHKVEVEELAGSNRVETAVEISKDLYPKGFAKDKQLKTVVLSTSSDFADALSAGPLAAQYGNAPLLLTDKQLNKEVMNELQRLKAEEVIIVGGPGAVSPAIETALTQQSYSVTRIHGDNRYETNEAIVDALDEVNGVFVASGEKYADALSAAPIAAADDWAILLTKQEKVSNEALNYLADKQVVVTGGTGVIDNKVYDKIHKQNGDKLVQRIAGADRYGTLVKLLQQFRADTPADTVVVATGKNFPDALTASSLAVSSKAPLVLIKNQVTEEMAHFLTEFGDQTVVDHVKVSGGIVKKHAVKKVVNLLD
ncbi:cell wall-binding repeat-containing protein [Pontibacillus salicampi]|uniref:Cell wall-binding repeat-containing protein n=1 Tax=Pontibacillus salicampi TaxID=1449801 RepID=A0ABV6LK51_9BACI